MTYSYIYDYEDRPVSVTGPTGTTIYSIDGLGHRVGKLAQGTQLKYVYDGDTVVATITPSGTSYHIPGTGFEYGGSQWYYQENALGSMLSTRTSAGAVSSRNEYDAYGITYPVVDGAKSEFRFAGSHGYMTDDDTGMLLLGHRYYLPQIGRFLTQDPRGQTAGLNLYTYCFDNPTKSYDRTGLNPIALALPFGLGGGLAASGSSAAAGGTAAAIAWPAAAAVVAVGTAIYVGNTYGRPWGEKLGDLIYRKEIADASKPLPDQIYPSCREFGGNRRFLSSS